MNRLRRFLRSFRLPAILLALCLGSEAVTGCVSRGAVPKTPECSDEQVLKIEKDYLAEAVVACAGKTYDTCPELPAIRAKADQRRKDFVECSK